MLEWREQASDGANRVRRTYWRTLRPIRQAWLHRDVTAADLAIASYPRSGNLWLRVLLLHVLLGRAPELDEVHAFVPHLGQHYETPRLLAGTGRLLKTHEPFRREYRRAVYVVRDPRDVCLSYYKHLQRRGSLTVPAQGQAAHFDRFIDAFLLGRHEPHGRWSSHVISWLDALDAGRADIFLIRYEHMRDDPRSQLDLLVNWLALDVDDALLGLALQSASIERMREITRTTDEAYNRRHGRAADTLHIVNSGRVGGWREVMTPEQTRRFRGFEEALARAGYEAA